MREVVCADAVVWLGERPRSYSAIVTGLPDAQEIGATIEEYDEWFRGAVLMTMTALADPGVVVFGQTDRKVGGGLYSKATVLYEIAARVGLRPLWHKIILRRDPGKVDLHRPGYSHLLAYGTAGARPGTATPDVLPRTSTSYSNGMDLGACRLAVELASGYSSTIVDPFCGSGTTLAVAEQLGLDAIGVDIDPLQVERAREYVLPEELF